MNEQLQLWNDAPTQHSVFFAARPDAATAARAMHIGQAAIRRQRLAAKPISPERLHVSLLGLGEFVDPLPSAIISEAMTVAGTVSMPPFNVVFDRVTSFGGGPGKLALVLTGGEGVAGLVRLQEALSLVLSKAGVGARRRKSSTPHLTIAYSDRACELAIEPICWTVNEFVLIDSLVGQSKHLLLGHWPCERLIRSRPTRT